MQWRIGGPGSPGNALPKLAYRRTASNGRLVRKTESVGHVMDVTNRHTLRSGTDSTAKALPVDKLLNVVAARRLQHAGSLRAGGADAGIREATRHGPAGRGSCGVQPPICDISTRGSDAVAADRTSE